MPQKIDYKAVFKPLYRPGKGKFTEVEVPALQFLMVDGQGNPGEGPLFEEAIGALYGLAFRSSRGLTAPILLHTTVDLAWQAFLGG